MSLLYAAICVEPDSGRLRLLPPMSAPPSTLLNQPRGVVIMLPRNEELYRTKFIRNSANPLFISDRSIRSTMRSRPLAGVADWQIVVVAIKCMVPSLIVLVSARTPVVWMVVDSTSSLLRALTSLDFYNTPKMRLSVQKLCRTVEVGIPFPSASSFTRNGWSTLCKW
jgi:hypothetical protein